MHVPSIRCNDLRSRHQQQLFLKNNVVDIVTKKQAWKSRVRISAETWDFHFFQSIQISSVVVHLPFQKLLGFFLSQEVRHLGWKVDHSCPFSAVVKNECSYAFTPPVHLHGRHKGQTLPFFTPDDENRATFWNTLCSNLKMMENVQNNIKV